MSDNTSAADMFHPAICRHCQHLHDAGKVETAARYADCSVWRCPRCTALIDDRPLSWGGSLTGAEARKHLALIERAFWRTEFES